MRLISSLEIGRCAGIVLGFDRLVMPCTGASRIEDVLWTPVD
jgi:elongation factor P--beta-lysine ligase